MKATLSQALIISTVASLGLLAAPRAQAVCVNPTCTQFDRGTPSVVTQTYTETSLTNNDRFQLGFSTTSSTTPFNLTSIEYSLNGGSSYTSIAASLVVTGPTFSYTSIVETSPLFVSNPFLVRYTIPGANAVSFGSVVRARLLSNDNGDESGGVLSDTNGENNYVLIQRGSVAVPIESDALPVVGAAVFMAGGLWWKRRRSQTKVADFIVEK